MELDRIKKAKERQIKKISTPVSFVMQNKKRVSFDLTLNTLLKPFATSKRGFKVQQFIDATT